MAEEANEDIFQYSARWNELRRLATADPDDEMFTDKLIALLEERDKELEYFLENRVTTNDLGGDSTGGRMPFAYVANRWYDGSLNADPNATSAIAADQINFVPISFPFDITITDVAVDVAATTGGNIRLGLYNTTSGIWLPGTLHTTFGTISVSGTGGNEINSLSVALSANTQYWLAYQSDTARTIAVMGPEGGPNGGFLNSGSNTPTRAIVEDPAAYSSGLTDPAGTPTSDPVDGFISIRFKFT